MKKGDVLGCYYFNGNATILEVDEANNSLKVEIEAKRKKGTSKWEENWNLEHTKNGIKDCSYFLSGFVYFAHHKPTKEDWLLIGVDCLRGIACAAGYPASIGYFHDFKNFEMFRKINKEELNHRVKEFGNSWL